MELTEFQESIILTLISIIVPSVIGLFTAKTITESWQDRREKYELQEKILSQVDKSYTDIAMDIYLVLDFAFDYYNPEAFSFKSGSVDFGGPREPSISQDELSKIVKNYTKNFDSIDDKSWFAEKNIKKLDHMLMIYFGDGVFIKGSSTNMLKESEEQILMKSLYNGYQSLYESFVKLRILKTGTEFEKMYIEFYDQWKNQLRNIKELKAKIINTKMVRRKI